MGQRLNISIERNGEVLANAYYHWAAYTHEALELTKTIITHYIPFQDSNILSESEKVALSFAVSLLEFTGAGINSDEHQRIEGDKRFSNMSFRTSVNRNMGLLSVTEKSIEETELWEEGRVTIDIGTGFVAFSVFCEYNRDEFEDEYSESIQPGGYFSDLKEYDFDFSPVPVTEFQKIVDAIEQNPCGFYHGDSVFVWTQ